MSNECWNKESWRSHTVYQKPGWTEHKSVQDVVEKLSQLPALVFAGETRTLESKLAEAAEGKTFILQCGDCSEDFSRCNGPRIHSLIKVILQISIIFAYAGSKEVVNIGRIAGQYAKPRSNDFENVGGYDLPSYRGDMVNEPEANLASRTPDPQRMLDGYFRAAATLNLVRAFMTGGYASLDHVQDWHRDFCDNFPISEKYEQLVGGIKKAISFISAMGIDIKTPQLNQAILYTSHEALLLDYEEAMTRIDTTTGLWYDTSAHLLWIGDRTRQADSAHVEFLRGVGNPLGLKIGPAYEIDEIKKVIEKLNPNNKKGRLSLITRFGANKIDQLLPPLINFIKQEGFNVVWICDPMHGNTYLSDFSVKTRNLDDIIEEVRKYYQVHRAEGSKPGGVHLELTGENVTECLGGRRNIKLSNLNDNYQTTCDPRLNAEQAVEFAFEVSELLNK